MVLQHRYGLRSVNLALCIAGGASVSAAVRPEVHILAGRRGGISAIRAQILSVADQSASEGIAERVGDILASRADADGLAIGAQRGLVLVVIATDSGTVAVSCEGVLNVRRAVAYIAHVEQHVPGQLLVDGEVIGVGQRNAVVVRIETGLAAGLDALSVAFRRKRLQLADLRGQERAVRLAGDGRIALERVRSLRCVESILRRIGGFLVAIGSPSAADHGPAVAEEIVGESDARRDEAEAIRLAAQGNASVVGMPVETRSILARIEFRQYQLRVEDSQARALAVIPCPDVLEAEADLHGEPLGDLERVICIDPDGLEGQVRQGLDIGLLVVGEVAHQEVDRRIIAAIVLTCYRTLATADRAASTRTGKNGLPREEVEVRG